MRNWIIAALLAVSVVATVILDTYGINNLQNSYNGTRGVVSNDYAQFMDNAEAGFMQIITIPEPTTLNQNDFGYMTFTMDNKFTRNHHTYAVGAFYPVDLRTETGCFEMWRFDLTPVDNPDYGTAFCMSDYNVKYLFENGAYALEYESY